MKDIGWYIERYGGYRGQNPDFPVQKWLKKIQLGETREGYWEWAYRNDWDTGPTCLECNDTGFIQILGQHKHPKKLDIRACSTCM